MRHRSGSSCPPILADFAGSVKTRIGLADVVEAALLAKGAATADILTQADQQGVVFIEEPGIRRQIIHKKGLIGTVTVAIRGQASAVDNAPGIGIDNKNWLPGSIQDYGIGGFLSNAMNGKKLLPEAVSIVSKELVKVIIVVFAQPVSERLEF
jgi:hypothetical protein